MERTDTRSKFDWYQAGVATGITAPFAIWALYVLLDPNWLAIGAAAVVFVTVVFWGFGRIRIGELLDGPPDDAS